MFVYIVVIVVATRLLYGKGMARRVPAVARPTPASDCDAGVDYGQLVRSIVISSFGKLLVVLMMIWESNAYYGPIVNLFVLTSNVTALRVFLKTTLLKVGHALRVRWTPPALTAHRRRASALSALRSWPRSACNWSSLRWTRA